MRKKEYLFLYILGLGATLIAALLIKGPGYMDAEYYAGGGIRLSEGKGFTEVVLWNYLDMPAILPHPSHTYWMPLPSIISALGIWLFRSQNYLAMQSGFILLAGLIPVLAAQLSQMFINKKVAGWMAGIISIFSGYLFIYYSLTETFVIYMVFGALITILLFENESNTESRIPRIVKSLIIGILVGLMHMSRADGVIWFGIIFLFMLIRYARAQQKKRFRILLFFVIGYLLITSPWYIRNINTFGSLIPAGNNLTLWITNYDQTFSYPATKLSLSSWLEQGIWSIISTRLSALWMNVKNLIAFQGMVILLPLMVYGVWKNRNDERVRFTVFMLLATTFIMTIVFPFAGSRGGYIHSSAANQIMLWALVPSGLYQLVKVIGKKRNWSIDNAFNILSVGIACILIGLTVGLFYQRVVKKQNGEQVWIKHEIDYSQVFENLSKLGMSEEEIVMVKNPPGWYFVNRQPAVVIPDGDETDILRAANQFDAKYLVLESEHVEKLSILYSQRSSSSDLRFLGEINGIQYYEITIKR